MKKNKTDWKYLLIGIIWWIAWIFDNTINYGYLSRPYTFGSFMDFVLTIVVFIWIIKEGRK